MEETAAPGTRTSRLRRQLASEPIGQGVVQLPDAGLMHVIDDVQSQLESLLETGPHALVVDMADVGRLSSTTIAVLLWVKRSCSARGVEVRLRHASRGDVDTLERVGLLGDFALETADNRTTPRPALTPPGPR